METMQSSTNLISTGSETDTGLSRNSPERRFEITGLAAEHIDKFWRFIEPRLSTTIEDYGHGEFSIEDIYRDLLAGKLQLWIVVREGRPHGYCVTRIVDYDKLRVCRTVLLVGDNFDDWFPALEARVSLWARSLGCTRLEASGRRGWARKLKAWNFAYVTMHKEL